MISTVWSSFLTALLLTQVVVSSPTDFEKRDSVVCQSGQGKVNGACQPCAAGTFSTAGVCNKCTLPAYSAAGASSCSSCSDGSASTDAITCTKCPPGRFSSGGAFCTLSLPGSFAAGSGNSHSTPCAPGSVAPAGQSSCRVCPLIDYTPDSIVCLPCQNDQLHWLNKNVCTACTVGTIKCDLATGHGIICAAGYSATSTGPCLISNFNIYVTDANHNEIGYLSKANYHDFTEFGSLSDALVVKLPDNIPSSGPMVLTLTAPLKSGSTRLSLGFARNPQWQDKFDRNTPSDLYSTACSDNTNSVQYFTGTSDIGWGCESDVWEFGDAIMLKQGFQGHPLSTNFVDGGAPITTGYFFKGIGFGVSCQLDSNGVPNFLRGPYVDGILAYLVPVVVAATK